LHSKLLDGVVSPLWLSRTFRELSLEDLADCWRSSNAFVNDTLPK
jgi:hypothetical protein